MCKLCKLWSLFKYSQSINLSKESNEKSSKIGYKCPSNFYMTIELLDKWYLIKYFEFDY